MKFFICVSITIILLILIPAMLFPLLTYKPYVTERIDYTTEFQEELVQICDIPNGEHITNMDFSSHGYTSFFFRFDFADYFQPDYAGRSFADEELHKLLTDLCQKIDEIFTLQLMEEHELNLQMPQIIVHLRMNQEVYMTAVRRSDYNDPFNLEGVAWSIEKAEK